MQLSPNELLKLLAATEKRTAEDIYTKIRTEVKPKRWLFKIGVSYRLLDLANDLAYNSFNIVMTENKYDIKQFIIDSMHELYGFDIVWDYDVVSLSIAGYGIDNGERGAMLYKITNIHDRVIEKIEI